MDYNNQQGIYAVQNKPINYRKYIIFAVIGIVAIAIIWFLSQYSFVKVQITSNNTSKEITYELSGQGKPETVTTSEKSIKKLLRKGSYEISATSGDLSGITFVSTSGFLVTKTADIKLAPQKQRTFIGNTPRPCMLTNHKTLITYACTDQITQAYVHVPSNETTPTYTKPIANPYSGNIEGQFKLGNKQYFALKLGEGYHDQVPHGIYELDSKQAISNVYPLDILDENEVYTVWKYRDGFVAIDSSLTTAYYYSSLTSKPEEIDLNQDKNKETKYPYDVDVVGNTILVASTDTEQADIDNESSESAPDTNTYVQVFKNGKFTSYTINGYHNEIKICGTTKVCGLHNEVLSVFDISGSKARHLYDISNVKYFDSNETRAVIAKSNETMTVDMNNNNGSIDFTSTNFTTCGLQLNGNSYLLCVSNRKSVQRVLEISEGNPSKIDEYISELDKITEIKTVSPYRNFIFISPDLGELKYNPRTNDFRYDKMTQTKVTKLINDTIKGLNPDPEYKFINPLSP